MSQLIAETSATIANLLAVYEGESNAHIIARVIMKLGGDARCEIHAVEVKSTLENLMVVLAGELYEIDRMYPASLPRLSGATLHSPDAALPGRWKLRRRMRGSFRRLSDS